MEKPIVRDVFFLRQKSTPAGPEDLPHVQDLIDTFRAHRSHCAGMAGNMIGCARRMIIAADETMTLVMLNPVILQKKQPYEAEEGCLSLSGTRKTVRFREITVAWQDLSFQKHTRKFNGWIAQVLQHEIDHLDGIII